MLRRRIQYGLVLTAALLFQLLYDRYLARFVLASVVSLPVLSLLLAFPSALCLRLRLHGGGVESRRNAAGQWRLSVERPAFLPIPQLKLRLQFRNDLTGWTEKKRVICDRPALESLEFPVPGEHCGRITCRVTGARLLDCLGLFAIPVRLPDPAAVLVMPIPAPPEELPHLELADAPTVTEGNQQVPNGDYELRDYRAGDPLRSVHWKLSMKRDELVVREWRGACRSRIILAVDRFGDPEQLDRVLDRFFALSSCLLSQDCPHQVQWTEAGEVRTVSLTEQGTLLTCMDQMLSSRAPLQGTPMRELLPQDGNVPYVFVTAGEEAVL